MPLPAEKVYAAAVNMVGAKGLKILKEKKNEYLQVTDGLKTVAYTTEADGPQKCKLTVSVEVLPEKGEKKEETKRREKELTLSEINNLSRRLNVKPTSIKQ